MQNEVMESFDNGWEVLNGAVKLAIPTRGGSGYVVPAWRLHVPGFEEFTIAIHKSMRFVDEWVISEGTTGMRMCRAYSIEGAIDTLQDFLREEKVTPEWLREKIESSSARLMAETATVE